MYAGLGKARKGTKLYLAYFLFVVITLYNRDYVWMIKYHLDDKISC